MFAKVAASQPGANNCQKTQGFRLISRPGRHSKFVTRIEFASSLA